MLLNSEQMAYFAARGFLRFDGVVPEAINQQFLQEVAEVGDEEHWTDVYQGLMETGGLPTVPAGIPLTDAYDRHSAMGRLLALPIVTGAIRSLVGVQPKFDHHFLHITFPPSFYEGQVPVAQHTHQDSTIDIRTAFDVQIMYFPHEVAADMGGTRFIPGTHLRKVSEASIGRYQNMLGQQHMVCPAGTLLFLHMGIWHGGGANRSDKIRSMLKIRICPTERQVRLWDTGDLPADHGRQRPIFWTVRDGDVDPVQRILMTPEPWFEHDTGRLEFMNRIRFWRFLLGDETWDADYWLTRIENEPG